MVQGQGSPECIVGDLKTKRGRGGGVDVGRWWAVVGVGELMKGHGGAAWRHVELQSKLCLVACVSCCHAELKHMSRCTSLRQVTMFGKQDA